MTVLRHLLSYCAYLCSLHYYCFMLLVISGTHREDSRTFQVAQHYFSILQSLKQDAHLLSLMHLNVLSRNEAFLQVERDLLIPAEKIIFIMPEYNGSFPGVLKALMDNSDIKKCFWNKKALLVGLADGRGGNLRGIEHMTNILHYLRMNVFYNKLPLSKINEELDSDGTFKHELTLNSIQEQISGFIQY